jgi:hypothetical protein
MINSINNYDRNLTVDFFKNIWQNDGLTKKDRYDLLHIYSDNFEFLETQDSIDVPVSQNEVIFRVGANESPSSYQQINKSAFEQNPILKYFYKTPANLLQLHTPSFELILNPVIQLSYHHQVNNENIVFQNIRGLEARAYIDKKVYFYTQLLETQRSFLNYTKNMAPYPDRDFGKITIPVLSPILKDTTISMPELM